MAMRLVKGFGSVLMVMGGFNRGFQGVGGATRKALNEMGCYRGKGVLVVAIKWI